MIHINRSGGKTDTDTSRILYWPLHKKKGHKNRVLTSLVFHRNLIRSIVTPSEMRWSDADPGKNNVVLPLDPFSPYILWYCLRSGYFSVFQTSFITEKILCDLLKFMTSNLVLFQLSENWCCSYLTYFNKIPFATETSITSKNYIFKTNFIVLLNKYKVVEKWRITSDEMYQNWHNIFNKLRKNYYWATNMIYS